MSIKLRAWDRFNDEMIYSDKFDDIQDFLYDVKRRENGGNKVSLMLASKCVDHSNKPVFEGDIIQFVHGSGMRTGTGIVECRPEHFCYWQVKVPGDHYGLGWVMNCCFGIQVTGNRYADREWLEDEGLAGLLGDEFVDQATANIAEAVEEMDRMIGERAAKHPEDFFASPKLATPKPARTESDYRDDFGHMIKEGDILVFTLCGRRFTGEVLKIFSPEAAKSSWQVWTYESPKLKLSLRHMCEDVACSKVRVIGHISTVRQGGVAVSDIGVQL